MDVCLIVTFEPTPFYYCMFFIDFFFFQIYIYAWMSILASSGFSLLYQLQEEYVAYGLSKVFGNYYPEEEGSLRFHIVAV